MTNTDTPEASGRWRWALIYALVFTTSLVCLSWFLSGKHGAEKTLTALVMPVGAFWLLLAGCIAERFMRGRLDGGLAIPARVGLSDMHRHFTTV